jgi:hypothetical protein
MPTESTADSIRGVKQEGSAPLRLDDTPEKSTADSATRMKQDVSAHESRPEIANGEAFQKQRAGFGDYKAECQSGENASLEESVPSRNEKIAGGGQGRVAANDGARETSASSHLPSQVYAEILKKPARQEVSSTTTPVTAAPNDEVGSTTPPVTAALNDHVRKSTPCVVEGSNKVRDAINKAEGLPTESKSHTVGKREVGPAEGAPGGEAGGGGEGFAGCIDFACVFAVTDG